jgi:cell division protease FtsH
VIAPLLAAALSGAAPAAQAADTQMPAAPAKTTESSYSTLQQAIEDRTVKAATLHPREGVAELELSDGRNLKVEYPPTDENLAENLADAGARVSVENRGKSSGLALFSMILLPILMFGALAFALMRGRGANGQGGGKQKVHGARVAEGDVPSVRFGDVAGVEEVVESLEDLLVFLKTPERFERLGAHLPRGVIFHGPPGTGKTLLAKALAGEAEVPFYNVSGSDFVEMFVGRGAARVRELFADARRNPAAVIFFD